MNGSTSRAVTPMCGVVDRHVAPTEQSLAFSAVINSSSAVLANLPLAGILRQKDRADAVVARRRQLKTQLFTFRLEEIRVEFA